MCLVLNSQVEEASLREEGFREAERHKWIESQKRGMDLGAAALDEWYRCHWPHYCRQRRLEHLVGLRRYREFRAEEFGMMRALLTCQKRDILLDRIVDRFNQGMENLELILWALDCGLPMEAVLRYLEALDVNSARLDPAPFHLLG